MASGRSSSAPSPAPDRRPCRWPRRCRTTVAWSRRVAHEPESGCTPARATPGRRWRDARQSRLRAAARGRASRSCARSAGPARVGQGRTSGRRPRTRMSAARRAAAAAARTRGRRPRRRRRAASTSARSDGEWRSPSSSRRADAAFGGANPRLELRADVVGVRAGGGEEGDQDDRRDSDGSSRCEAAIASGAPRRASRAGRGVPAGNSESIL